RGCYPPNQCLLGGLRTPAVGRRLPAKELGEVLDGAHVTLAAVGPADQRVYGEQLDAAGLTGGELDRRRHRGGDFRRPGLVPATGFQHRDLKPGDGAGKSGWEVVR